MTVGFVVAMSVTACGRSSASSQPSQTAEAVAHTENTTPLASGQNTIRLTDDGGHVVSLTHPAQRIISLIPSATETLISLGLAKRMVGRTRYDVDPSIAAAPIVGGGIDPSIETIVGLHPDLVLDYWDNDKGEFMRNKLVALGVPVFTVHTEDTSDVYRTISNIGRLTGTDSVAIALSASIRAQLDEVRRSVMGKPTPSVLYVVYNDPPMTAGAKTFISELISLAGGRSIFNDLPQLWPNITMEEVVRRQPDLVVVPYGEFKNNSLPLFRAMPGWKDLKAIREGHVVMVSANLVSRPGPHMGEAARLLRASFHPEFARAVDSARGGR